MTCFSIVLVAVSASAGERGNIAGGGFAYHFITKHSLRECLPEPLHQQNMSPHAARPIVKTTALKPNMSLAKCSTRSMTHLSEMPQTLPLPNSEVNKFVWGLVAFSCDVGRGMVMLHEGVAHLQAYFSSRNVLQPPIMRTYTQITVNTMQRNDNEGPKQLITVRVIAQLNYIGFVKCISTLINPYPGSYHAKITASKFFKAQINKHMSVKNKLHLQ